MKRMLLMIFALIIVIGSLTALAQVEKREPATGRMKMRSGLPQIAAREGKKVDPSPVEPAGKPLAEPIYIGPKSKDELVKGMRGRFSASLSPQIDAALVAIPKDAPANQVVITTDFRAQGSSGGSIIALRDSNGDGLADQQTIMATNPVESGDAITKIVPSQLFFGRYFAITEESELIQIDDTDGDYIAEDVTAFEDFQSSTGLGIGISTGVLDDGTEAIYLMKIEPGGDRLFYTADDSVQMIVFLDRNKNGEVDTTSRFFSSRTGFTSLGAFSVGVETALIFNLGQYDNSGRVTRGALYSYYDTDGNGVPDDFSSNNNGIFVEGAGSDLRPAVATDIVQVGTDYYVTAPLTALGLARNDDIAIYSDFNASQVADGAPFIFGTVSGLGGFSSDLGGLAVSLDGKRVAMARNLVVNGDVQNSSLLFMDDLNFDGRADRLSSELFNNGNSGLGGVCFSNVELLGPQPIIIFPRLKSKGKFVLDAIGARIDSNALLIVDGREQFSFKLNGSGTSWIVTANTRSRPGNLSVTQALGSGTHTLLIKNGTGQESLPILFRR
jgi:hypothetical protein